MVRKDYWGMGKVSRCTTCCEEDELGSAMCLTAGARKYSGIRKYSQCSFSSDSRMEDWSLKKILHHATCSGMYLEDWEVRKVNISCGEHQNNLGVKQIPQDLKHCGTKNTPVCTANSEVYRDTHTKSLVVVTPAPLSPLPAPALSPLPAPALSPLPSPSHQHADNPDGVHRCASVCVTSRKTLKGMMMETTAALLLLLLLLTSPVNGRFDRGGPQHSITWGRGNSPSSAVFANPPSNVTAVRGHRARLPCQVKNLGHKDVSWIRQRDLHILTVGIFTYTTDDRFKVHHAPDTEDWHLDISPVTFRDTGVYECQVSTSPKVSLPIHLNVQGQQAAEIRGPGEVYVQKGSTISLECEVKAGVQAVGAVRWYHGNNPLNYSSPRGGISMEVEKTPTLTTSRLHITRAGRPDSGNYTCHPLLARPASVTVHVVSAGEESAAAVQSVCVGARACPALVWAAMGAVVWAGPLLLTRLHHARPSHPQHSPS